MEKIEVETISTGERSSVKVTIVVRDEEFFIDARHMFKDDFGHWLHTKKGLHVTLEVAEQVCIVLAQAIKEAKTLASVKIG